MEARRAIEEAGLEIRVVKPLKPSGKVTLIAERFADTWTKLAVFDLVEFEVSRGDEGSRYTRRGGIGRGRKALRGAVVGEGAEGQQ
jgi:hypothetical protein